MTQKLVRGLLALFLILGMSAWGCGGGGGFQPEPDADGEMDGGDVGDDVPTDTPSDVPTDTPADVVEDDGGAGRTYIPFETETSGGEIISSTNYTLELFVAPARPVGNVSSTNYQFKLGPGGIRSHR